MSALEGAGGGGQLAAGLALGVETLSENQTVTFTQYRRLVLPLDGFVFWVKADQLSLSALYNTAPLNTVPMNEVQAIEADAATWVVKGSLHYASDNKQDETEGFAVNRVIFTSLSEVEQIQAPNPGVLYIGEFDGMKFSFSRRMPLYRQAGLFHYQGDAVYPTMMTQLVDDPRTLDVSNVVVSNSLPIWLALNRFAPMFPSFLINDGQEPPYIAVHIDEMGTAGLQAAPLIDPNNGSHYQLARDRVRLTSYGLRNHVALGFQDYMLDYSANDGAIGIMNIPIWRDAKRTQTELNTIAMKKTMDVEVNYYQTDVRSLAIQYIKSCFIDLLLPQ